MAMRLALETDSFSSIIATFFFSSVTYSSRLSTRLPKLTRGLSTWQLNKHRQIVNITRAFILRLLIVEWSCQVSYFAIRIIVSSGRFEVLPIRDGDIVCAAIHSSVLLYLL